MFARTVISKRESEVANKKVFATSVISNKENELTSLKPLVPLGGRKLEKLGRNHECSWWLVNGMIQAHPTQRSLKKSILSKTRPILIRFHW